jgi:PAS domain S-box-containing protein
MCRRTGAPWRRSAPATSAFKQLFADAPIAIAIAIAVIDPTTGTMLELNHRFVAMAGRPEDELVGQAFVDLVDDDDRGRVSTAVFELDEGAVPSAGFQRGIRTPAGERWLRATVSLVDLAPATGRRLLLEAEDITAILGAEVRLEHLALHDDLTELPDRALALDRVSKALATSRRARTYVGVRNCSPNSER